MTARRAGSRVLVSIRVNAPAVDAFRAFTEEICEWWQPNPIFAFSRNKSGVLSFVPGAGGRLVETYADGTHCVVGEVLVWDEPHELALTWHQAGVTGDQTTELHVSFDPAGPSGRHTKVTVEHFGWDRIPREHVARHGFELHVIELRFAEWWQRLLGALRDQLNEADTATPVNQSDRGS